MLFDEPGGLSISGNKLYIADTNNHVIRVADIETREVTTLVLVDLDGLLTRRPNDAQYNGKLLTLDPQTIAPGDGTIELNIILPEGYKVNDRAPFSVEWLVEGNEELIQFPDGAIRTMVEPAFPLSFPAEFSEGETELTADLVIYYCEAAAESLCFIERIRITTPVTITSGGMNTVSIPSSIELP